MGREFLDAARTLYRRRGTLGTESTHAPLFVIAMAAIGAPCQPRSRFMNQAHPLDNDDNTVPYVAFAEFRSGLPLGRFRVVVDPERSRRYVTRRLNVLPFSVMLIGVGLALVLSGSVTSGAALVFAGVIVKRAIQWQAPKILLYLAARNPTVYAEATDQALLEVRRAA